MPPIAAPAPPPATRTAPSTRLIGLGAVAVGLAALPYKLFELDRFFVPKEVVVQVVAAAALWRLWRSAATPHVDDPPADGGRAVDLALAAFLLLSAASAALAPSGWLALRALGASAAGAGMFWAARAAGRAGDRDAVLLAVAWLPAVALATALAQAYGLESEYFSVNRAPGGTFGNRNSVAHLCAIGLPVLAYLALRGRRGAAWAAGAAFAAASATLVLTRSRAAWLAAGAAAVPFALGVARAAAAARPAARPAGRGAQRAGRPAGGRAVALVAAGVLAAGAAVRLPNALDWRSDSPYLDSARDLVNYREGSGRGRLAQWRHSARLVAEDPVLGVGPGNWSVRYPSAAPAGDASLTAERTTANPWPSSDWVAFASERGAAGAAALGTALALLLLRAHRLVWRAPTAEDRLRGGALGAVLAAALVAGAFDAVLLLAAPAFLVWTAAGALAAEPGGGGAGSGAQRRRRAPDRALAGPLAGALAGPLAGPLAGALLASAALGAAHAAAMALFAGGRPAQVAAAARLAPGDYRVQLRAAQVAQGARRCGEAEARAAAAQRLAPRAAAPARVLRACGAPRRAPGSRAALSVRR